MRKHNCPACNALKHGIKSRKAFEHIGCEFDKNSSTSLEQNGMLRAVLSQDDLLKIGFKKLPHFTVNNAMIMDIGRNRHLSVGNVGTPNEMLFIFQSDDNDFRKITDLVCLHNYDYDGYLSKQKLQKLIESIGVSVPCP